MEVYTSMGKLTKFPLTYSILQVRTNPELPRCVFGVEHVECVNITCWIQKAAAQCNVRSVMRLLMALANLYLYLCMSCAFSRVFFLLILYGISCPGR